MGILVISYERYCRQIIARAQQRLVPFATIMKLVLQMAQLSTIAMRFEEVRKALLFGKSDGPVDVSKMERIYPDCKLFFFYSA